MIRIDDRDAILRAGMQPHAVASSIVSMFAEMLCVHGVVHADPHAGNMHAPRPFYHYKGDVPPSLLILQGNSLLPF